MLKGIKKEAGFIDGNLCNEQSKDKVVKFCKQVRFWHVIEIALTPRTGKKTDS